MKKLLLAVLLACYISPVYAFKPKQIVTFIGNQPVLIGEAMAKRLKNDALKLGRAVKMESQLLAMVELGISKEALSLMTVQAELPFFFVHDVYTMYKLQPDPADVVGPYGP